MSEMQAEKAFRGMKKVESSMQYLHFCYLNQTEGWYWWGRDSHSEGDGDIIT